MITKTIGIGGDYSDIGSAWAALPSTFLDDYTFNIISDFVENTGINSGVRFDGHILNIINIGAFVITFLNATIKYNMLSTVGLVTDTLNLTGLIIKSPAANTLFVLSFFAGNQGNTVTANYKNIKIIGQGTRGTNSGIAISDNYRACNATFLNCLFENLGKGIIYEDTATVNSINYVENCIIHNCNTGISLNEKNVATVSTRIKNTVSCGCSTKDWSITNNTYDAITNCADGDNTVSATTAILSGNITGIVDGDFLSIDSTNDNFLKIDENSGLFEKGTTTISVWNTEGIDGLARPNNIGKVSIGINEPIHKEKCMIKELECFLAKKQVTFGAQGDDLTGDNYFPALPDSKVEIIPAMTDIETVSAIYDQDIAVRGMVNANAELSCYMRSLGDATEPDYALLARASGWAVAGPTGGKYTLTPIINPTTSTGDDLEVWHYLGGIGSNASVLTKIGNVIGNWKITGDVGKPVVFSLTGAKGIFITQAAATMVTSVVKDRTLIPAALPVTVSINGVVYKIMKFSFDGGNSVEQYIDCAATYGFGDSEITKKKVKFSFTCYANAALANPLDAVIAGDVVADVSIIWGKALYTTKILVDDPQFTDCKTVDVGGLTGWEVTGNATQNDITIVQNNDHV
jgi:hypothetical protein